MQRGEGTVHRALVVRQGHEVVGRALEQETALRGLQRHGAREILARVMQETHLGDTRHGRH